MSLSNGPVSRIFDFARTTSKARALCTGVLGSAAMLAFAAAPGCIVVDDDHDDDDIIIVDDEPTIESVPIDLGSGISAEPGDGAGIFVEYLGDGEWNVWLTCDTNKTGRSCAYDIFATGDDIVASGEDDLEAEDAIYEDFDQVSLYADTTDDYDGFFFKADPGEAVAIEVWLDGAPDGSLVFWVADGTLLQGMPTNPTFFVP